MADEDKMMPITEAVKRVTGVDVSYATGQWMKDDLRTYMLKGRRLTTCRDVRNYIAAKSEPKPSIVIKGRSESKRQRDIARASKALAKAGL